MKNLTDIPRLPMMGLLTLTIVFFSCCGVSAQAEHRGYMNALKDLRAARWLIDQREPGNDPSTGETAAMHSIEVAVAYIINADIDDGKYYRDYPDVAGVDLDTQAERIQRAMQLLAKARADVKLEEEANFYGGLQAHVITNIDDAVRYTEQLQALADK